MRVFFVFLASLACVLVLVPVGSAQIVNTMPSTKGTEMPSAILALDSNAPRSSAVFGTPMPSAASRPPKDTDSRPKHMVDINSAAVVELSSLPVLSPADVNRIIKARPYSNKLQLLTEGIVTSAVYEKVKDFVVAAPLGSAGSPVPQ
jgi:DNA uptake protein ComE-like DNA-binding protein